MFSFYSCDITFSGYIPYSDHPRRDPGRFDGRAHLDTISDVRAAPGASDLDGLAQAEADQINFERYRILVQNEFAGRESTGPGCRGSVAPV